MDDIFGPPVASSSTGSANNNNNNNHHHHHGQHHLTVLHSSSASRSVDPFDPFDFIPTSSSTNAATTTTTAAAAPTLESATNVVDDEFGNFASTAIPDANLHQQSNACPIDDFGAELCAFNPTGSQARPDQQQQGLEHDFHNAGVVLSAAETTTVEPTARQQETKQQREGVITSFDDVAKKYAVQTTGANEDEFGDFAVQHHEAQQRHQQGDGFGTFQQAIEEKMVVAQEQCQREDEFGDFVDDHSNSQQVRTSATMEDNNRCDTRHQRHVVADDDDGFGEFAEPSVATVVQISSHDSCKPQLVANDDDDEDDGFGDFEVASTSAAAVPSLPQEPPAPPLPPPSSASVPSTFAPLPGVSLTDAQSAMQSALDDVGRHFGAQNTQLHSEAAGESSRAVSTKFRELQLKRRSESARTILANTNNGVGGTSTFDLTTSLTSRISSILAATHRAATVGSVQVVEKHEKRSVGKVYNVLPIIASSSAAATASQCSSISSQQKILLPIDMKNFVKIVCW